MADITLETDAAVDLHTRAQPRSLVWKNSSTGYVFYVNSSNELVYKKTTDSGSTWGSAVSIETLPVFKYAIWYDKWTSGDTGNKIHITWVESTDDDIHYVSLDTSSDTLGTEYIVYSGTDADTGASDWTFNCISITKARSGNLFVGGWIDNDGENGLWKSTDNGATWSSKTSVADGTAVDRIMFLPGNEADNNDIWALYHDASSNAITLKVYDDSANSWSESSTIATASENADYFNFDCMTRFSDGHGILAIWDAFNTTTMNLEVYDITDISTNTKLTDVTSDNLNYNPVGLLINQNNDDLYVFYTDGTTNGTIKYERSTDDGSTWESPVSVSVTSDDHRCMFGGTSIDSSGGRVMPVWFNEDLGDLVTNYDNSLSIEAGLIQPSVQTLALTQQTPTLSLVSNITLTPSAQALTLTQASATSLSIETASALSISSSQLSPTIKVDDTITPSTQAMTLSLPSPSYATNDSYAPAAQALTLTQQTATFSSSSIQPLSALSATFSQLSPTLNLISNSTLTPSAQSLSLSQPAINISTAANLTVSPSALSVSLTQQNITPVTTDSYSASAQALTLTQQGITLLVGDSYSPSAQALTLNQLSPTFVITDSYSATAQTMTLTQQTPAYVIGDSYSASAQSLTLTQETPTYNTITGATYNASALSLSLTQQTSVYNANSDITIGLINYYPCNTTSGTTLIDAVGSNNGAINNQLTNTPTTFVSGKVENCIDSPGQITLIDEMSGSDIIGIGMATNYNKIAQSFVMPSGEDTAIAFGVKRATEIGSPSNSIRFSLRADNSGSPDSSSLFTRDMNDATFDALSTSTDGWVYLSCSGLTPGNTYWIVYESTSAGSDTNYKRIYYDSAGDYGVLKQWNGSSWNTITGSLRFTVEKAQDITLASAISLPYNSFSISWWMKKSNSRYECIFSKARAGSEGAIEITTSNSIRWESSTNNVSQRDFATGIIISDGSWHHYVLTSGASNMKLYVDGSLADTESANTDTVNQTYRYICSAQSSPYVYGRSATCNLDEIGFWNRELTLSEVSRLYNTGLGLSFPSVTTGTPESVASTTAIIGDSLNTSGNGTISDRGIYWDITSSVTTSDTKIAVAGTSGYYDANMSGLTKKTKYFVKAYATNELGTTIGDLTSFTTLDIFTLTTNPTHGTITLNPSGGTYDEGTVVNCEAVGDRHYAFSDWDGDLTSTTSTESLTMDSNKYIKSNFRKRKVARSKYIELGNKTITQARLISTTTSDSFTYWLCTDGTSWEQVSNNVLHTFENTGNSLKYEIVDTNENGGTISKIIVKDY